MFVGAVAELSAIEFLIAEIIAEVSSLRKKMSIEFGILAVRATGSKRSVSCSRNCKRQMWCALYIVLNIN
jgi:hypothetical protein